jgi:hypothetical protein
LPVIMGNYNRIVLCMRVRISGGFDVASWRKIRWAHS